MADEVLTTAALNRAHLARQHLLARTKASVPTVVEHLLGLQAQEPRDPYVALVSRIEGFDPRTLGRLLETRKLVRLTLMRGTIHLVTVRDAYALRPIMQPVLERLLQSRRRHLAGIDLDEVAAAGRAILAKEPVTYAELGKRLFAKWPNSDAEALARVVQVRVPLPQVPPRGVWGKSGVARHTPLESWARAPPARTLDLETLVRRYLGAFGPASVMDMQMWCALTRLKAVFDRLGSRLVTFRSPDGTRLYDLPASPRPPPDTPAPPRFLPVYDNLVIGLKDRTRVVDPKIRGPSVNPNEQVRYVLVRGVLGATWKIAQAKGVATLTVEPFVKTTADERAAILDEGERLLEHLYPDAPERRARIA